MATKQMTKAELVEFLENEGEDVEGLSKDELMELYERYSDADEDTEDVETETDTVVKKDRHWTEEQKQKLRDQWTPERKAEFAQKMRDKYASGQLTGRKWTDEEKQAHRERMKARTAKPKA